MTNDVRQVVEKAAEEQAREMARWLNDVGLGDYPVSPHPESMSVGEACYVDLKARLLVAIGDVAKSARERAEKAEADLERLKTGKWFQQLRALWDEILPREPMCRDCADYDGRCPHNGEPCDPNERAIAIVKRLKASPPAPSGWQQRIAAHGRDTLKDAIANRFAARVAHHDPELVQVAIRTALDEYDAGQNAKDALPQ